MKLRCIACGAIYADAWRCTCGGTLAFAEQPHPAGGPPDPGSVRRGSGVWAFDELLPAGTDPVDRVTLGEGLTPTVGSSEWNAWFKLEYVSPTGSFKDRGAATIVTRAAELGEHAIADDSSGNAGTAIAAYGARADLDVTIFAPDSISAAKRRMMEQLGAEVAVIPGARADVTAACHDAVEAGDAWYASHAWHPAFFAGTATFAYEVAMDREWTVPDALVLPVGHGTLFVGAYRGFERLAAAGWIDRTPRLYCAQTAAIAPIVETLHDDASPAEPETDTRAAGIRIADPVQREQIVEGIEATDGDAVAVSESALDEAVDRLHAEGFYVEPTAAVAPAALDELRDRGAIDRGEEVVVPLTGTGLKS